MLQFLSSLPSVFSSFTVFASSFPALITVVCFHFTEDATRSLKRIQKDETRKW